MLINNQMRFNVFISEKGNNIKTCVTSIPPSAENVNFYISGRKRKKENVLFFFI